LEELILTGGQRFHLGAGALAEAGRRLREMSPRRPLVVISRGRLAEAGEKLAAAGLLPPGSVFFHDFSVNPGWEEILAGSSVFRNADPDLVIAVGGGSAIDAGKLIKALARAENANPRPDGIRVRPGGPPLAAVATTAGSGSEATPFATFYVGETKHSLDHPALLPEIAVADPALSSALPPRLTAATGFDALAQAVESYWARGATTESRRLAKKALGLVLPNLPGAVENPLPARRLALAEGAYWAGRAIAISLTTAPHALSYFLTRRHGIPHGHAVALTLANFIRINAESGEDGESPPGEAPWLTAGREAPALLDRDSPAAAAAFWRELLRRCGLAATLPEAGISPGEIAEMVERVNPERLANNPVAVSRGRLIRELRVDF
jgi:alcohol dehydrogenase class IV